MDNGGEDDQASGWMQVKKKHRSNIKSSVNGWVGRITSRQTSGYPKNRVSNVQETRTEMNKSLSAKTSKDSPLNVTTSVNTSISLENGPPSQYLDKCVVSQGEKNDLEGENSLKSNPRPQVVFGPESKQNDGVLPKIKWGDLDEGTLLHYGKPYVSGFDCEVENCNLVSMSSGSDGESFHQIPVDAEENKCEETIIKDKDNVNLTPIPNSPSLSEKVTCVEGSSGKIDETSSDIKEEITMEKIVIESPTVSSIGMEHAKLSLKTNDSLESSKKVHAGGINEKMESENADSNTSSDICVVPLASESSDIQVLQNIKSSTIEPILPSSSSVEESFDKKHKPKAENVSNGVVGTSSDASGESKERFRERLWCFLFENLNRAVDELYLLCELECDLDQMKEAGLVLDEAASDFRELSSRVENFEELKRSSPRGTDGTSLLMQSDHRRPHALSWEVRRMTTSPRRAEILSPSLEAFRKIQEERTRERAKSAESQEYDDDRNCILESFPSKGAVADDSRDTKSKMKKLIGVSDIAQGSAKGKKVVELIRPSVASTPFEVKDNKEFGDSASVSEKQILEKTKILPKELYSPELQLFKDLVLLKENSLKDVISKLQLHAPSVLRHMSSVLQPILEKGILDHSIVHKALLEYFTIADKSSVAEIVQQLSGPSLVRMIHVKDGSRVAILCLKYGSAKERKKIIKGMKGHVEKIAHDKFGSMVLVCLFSTVDDTKLVSKTIIRELEANFKGLLMDQFGRRPIMQLLHPNCSRYFKPDDLESLNVSIPSLKNKGKSDDHETEETVGEDDHSEGGKKDSLKRRKELLIDSGLAEKLVDACCEFADELLRSQYGHEVIYEVAVGGCDGILSPISDEKLGSLYEAISSLAAQPKLDDSEENEHILEGFYSNRTIKKLVLDCPVFATTLWEKALKGNCSTWVKGHSLKVIDAYLKTSNDEVRKLAKHELKPLIASGDLSLPEAE